MSLLEAKIVTQVCKINRWLLYFGCLQSVLLNALQVNDYLLPLHISPIATRLMYFLSMMSFPPVLRTLMAGVPRYGCVVNPQKVAVNFPLGEWGSCPAGVRLLPLHCLFPWCGLLLNTHTLDVHNNYAR